MADYSAQIALATRLISTKGLAGMSILRRAAGATDPRKPWAPGPATEEAVVSGFTGAILGLKKNRFGMGEESQSARATATCRALVAAGPIAPIVPIPGDVLQVGPKRYQVVDVETLQPAEQAILFTIYLKD